MTYTSSVRQHIRPAKDVDREQQALRLTLDLLQSPSAQGLLHSPTISVLRSRDEQIHYGDIRLTWDGSDVQRHIEIKTVSHTLITDDLERAGDPTGQRSTYSNGNPYPTTICEVWKVNERAPSSPACLADILGIDREALLGTRVRSQHQDDFCIRDLPAHGHHNLDPFINGATAFYVDVREHSINVHTGAEILEHARDGILAGNVHDSPGGCDPGTMLVRGIPYGQRRLVRTSSGWVVPGEAGAHAAERAEYTREIFAARLAA